MTSIEKKSSISQQDDATARNDSTRPQSSLYANPNIRVFPGDFRKVAPPNEPRLILTDPPYNIGHDYGEVSDRRPDYLEMMHDFGGWAFKVAAADAHLFVVHYPEFFFEHRADCFTAQGWEIGQRIAWCYPSNIGHSNRAWTRSSRDIWRFSKGSPGLNPKADPEPYKNPTDKRVKALIDAGSSGRAPYDWWTFDLQKNVGRDHAGYANQLPRPLLRRIILATTQPGDVVADPFAGTGSTLREAIAQGRKAWGSDVNPNAPVHTDPVQEVFQ